jgi:hypothetical protein
MILSGIPLSAEIDLSENSFYQSIGQHVSVKNKTAGLRKPAVTQLDIGLDVADL